MFNIRRLTFSALLPLMAILWLTATANATTYHYTSNIVDGKYMTATANLDCVGPCATGNYSFGSGLSSFTLSVYEVTNTLLASLSSDAPGVRSYGENIRIVDGAVENWRMFLSSEHATNQFSVNNEAVYGVHDFALFQDNYIFTDFSDMTGSWTTPPPVSAVPLPGALPLFMAAAAMLGFAARRKRTEKRILNPA